MNERDFKRWWRKGLSIPEIANKMWVTTQDVREFAAKLGLKPRQKGGER